MKNLLNGELITLLVDSSQVTNKEMQNAYEDFVAQMTFLNQSEADYSDIFRNLSFTRVELTSLEASLLCGQGEKCA